MDERAMAGRADAGAKRDWRFAPSLLASLPPAELAARKAALRRLAAAHLPGAARAPDYDPLPVILPGALARRLGAALCRRAALLGVMIDDLYGQRQCLADGTVPAPALFSAAEWLRPMVSEAPLSAPRLVLYAADLALDVAGGAVVLRDHVDNVPGLGHAIALRRFISAAMPELLRSLTLASRQPLIERWREEIDHWAGGGPVALLESEDDDGADAALLARVLGALRLRPADLDCFGEAPEFRTLAGTETVRLLIRRMPATAIDPLEQGGAPASGVAGVFGAIRRGRLAMLNAPGTGVIAAPGVAEGVEGAIAALHRARFGEALALHRAATAVLPFAPLAPEAGASEPGTAPFVLRLFALHCGAAGWVALPGGLGLALGPDGRTQMKDVFVLDHGEDGAAPEDMAPEVVARAGGGRARAATSVLPSRVADDLFWLGRAVERLEAAARLGALALDTLAEASALPHEQHQRGLLAFCLAHQRLISPDLAGRHVAARQLRDSLTGGAVLGVPIGMVRRLLAATSDRFSATMLTTIEAALERVRAAREGGMAALVPASLALAASFAGVIGEDAAQDGAFLFAELGRRLERLFTLSGSFAILLGGAPTRLAPGIRLAVALIDAAMICEQRYGGVPEAAVALRLLLGDLAYPRSLGFQAAALAAGFARLDATAEREEARAIGLALEDASTRMAPGAALAAVEARAAGLCERLTGRLFAPPASRQHRDGAAPP